MAGYQTIQALRPILHRGPVPTPVVNRELVRPAKPLTELQVRQAKMREMRASGVSTYAIAREFKTSRASVQRATCNMPVPEGGWPNGGKQTRFNRAKAQRMHRAGFTYKEIAEDFGCSESNAHKLVIGYNTRAGSRVRATRKFEEMVTRATGISELRFGGAKAAAPIIGAPKARSILYWLIRQRRPDLTLSQIGHYLGGVHIETIRSGAYRCGEIAEHLGIFLTDPRSGGKACRTLWAADWREVGK